MNTKLYILGHPARLVAILILLTLLSAGSLKAQRIHAFVTSGMAVSQIEGDELKGFKHIGHTGGVGALAALDDRGRWGLSIEALFCQRGTYNNTGDPYSIRLTLPYVDIPLLFHYQDPYGGMLFGLGMSYGRMVAQPHNVMKYDPDYFVPDTTDFTFLKGDLCVVADARFTIWRGLQLDLRFQHSVLPVKRDWLFNSYEQGRWKQHTRNCYNQSVSIRLIYQF